MFYDVTIKDKYGKVKQVISGPELELKHWGVGVECPVCSRTFLPKLRRGPQYIVTDVPNDDPAKRKDRTPVNKYCSGRCRSYAKERRKRNLVKPKSVVMGECQVCNEPFPVKNNRHRNCSIKCRRVHARRYQAIADANAKRQREKRKAVK